MYSEIERRNNIYSAKVRAGVIGLASVGGAAYGLSTGDYKTALFLPIAAIGLSLFSKLMYSDNDARTSPFDRTHTL